jgi:hypothetical protein
MALNQIRSNARGTKINLFAGEPKWFDVLALSDLTVVLGLANSVQIVSAITASSIQLGPFIIANPIEEIRRCRNFVAHKGDGTLAQVRAHVGAGFTDLCHHVRSKQYGVDLFSDWKEGCGAIAIAAAQ